jgi:replicative DNA helicase
MTRKELEAVCVGILLANPEVLPKSDLELSDFACEPWKSVFSTMRAIISQGLEVDTFSVYERLQGVPLQVLADESLNARAAQNLPHYVSELRKSARKEGLQELCGKSVEALNEGHDADKVRGRLITRLSEMDSRGSRQDFNIHELTNLAVSHLEAVQEAKKSGRIVGVPSGIIGIDAGTGGFHKSNMIVIGARPGMGKTACGLSVAVNASREGYKVGFISTEMSAVEVGMRLMSLVSGVSSTSIRDASITPAGYQQIMNKSAELRNLPIRVLDKPSCSVADVMMQARAWLLSGGLDLLIVDYLQRLVSDERGESRTREVGKFASGMKTIARQLQIPVIALSQINRASTQRADRRPTMADLRDSGEIEQEADMVMLLNRPRVYDDKADEELGEIIVEKNRHGPTSLVHSCWQGKTMCWSSPTPEQVTLWRAAA